MAVRRDEAESARPRECRRRVLTLPPDPHADAQPSPDDAESSAVQTDEANQMAMTGTGDSPADAAATTIVGVGASAGGLEALGQFVANLPDQSRFAYVVAQHLANLPEHAGVTALTRDAIDGDGSIRRLVPAPNVVTSRPHAGTSRFDKDGCISPGGGARHAQTVHRSVLRLTG